VVNIAIVIGAGSSIGGSLINELASDESVDRIVAVGRAASPEHLEHSDKVSYLRSDYSEESISAVCTELDAQ
jgi:NAD(P)-dependent dehydrogenase (short-subunit alcohol dehydrogenase family)